MWYKEIMKPQRYHLRHRTAVPFHLLRFEGYVIVPYSVIQTELYCYRYMYALFNIIWKGVINCWVQLYFYKMFSILWSEIALWYDTYTVMVLTNYQDKIILSPIHGIILVPNYILVSRTLPITLIKYVKWTNLVQQTNEQKSYVKLAILDGRSKLGRSRSTFHITNSWVA